MEKPTTTLTAQDRVILFCVATRIDHGAIGISIHAMQSMAFADSSCTIVSGFIAPCLPTKNSRPPLSPSGGRNALSDCASVPCEG
jgi:hypothetical protein